MSEEQSLQDSLDKLTGEAAEQMEQASKDMDSYGKVGGKLSSEEEVSEAVNLPEPQDAGSESQPPESPPVEEPGFLQDKYGAGNWKEADRGYLNLQETLKSERAQRELERQQYLQYIQSTQQPKVEIVDPLKQLEDVGIPGDALGAVIDARAMQKVQPEIKKLQEKYKKDSQKLIQAVMEVYKEHKVNPIGGCLPMLIQMPVLIALYQVFLHAIDLRQAPFLFWINDLSSPEL